MYNQAHAHAHAHALSLSPSHQCRLLKASHLFFSQTHPAHSPSSYLGRPISFCLQDERFRFDIADGTWEVRRKMETTEVRAIKTLYLYHNWPAWYQFVTATFCHANWNHLSSNLFFLYIFGKLVEEEEGNFGLWLSYILTGAGANLVSWLVLPRNAVSVGASGAVFGLFAISVLVKISWDWRKILEVLILGQFVIEKVMEAAQASTGLSGTFLGGYSIQSINHIAHLSGALIGVLLVWLLSRVPSQPSNQEVSTLHTKTDTTQ